MKNKLFATNNYCVIIKVIFLVYCKKLYKTDEQLLMNSYN